jgi:hypothetical protein
MSKNPISRAGNSYFARVYRDDWVGPRSFADSKYGGNTQAAAAAQRWVTLAEAALPIIPAKPILKKATVHLRTDSDNPALKYYDVYLGTGRKEVNKWTRAFYFWDPAQLKIFRNLKGTEKINFTVDTEAVAKEKAYALRDERNATLQAEFHEALIAWHLERDRIMEKILALWPEVKAMPV